MGDVDVKQAFYARYFYWMDDGLGLLLRELGNPMSEFFAAGFSSPVVDSRCRYESSIGLGDIVRIETAVVGARRSSFDVGHVISVEGRVAAQGVTTHVWIALYPDMRATPLPLWLASAVDRPVDYNLT